MRTSSSASIGVLFTAIVVLAAPTPAQDARSVAAVHERLVDEGVSELERQNDLLRESWTRVEAGASAMVEAERRGDGLDSLRAREDQLQQLEAQLLMRLFEVQRARRDVLTHLAVIEAAGGVASSAEAEGGLLTGRWQLNVQPDLEGTAYLVQQGTLISGTYELSGGWSGSLRGTLVANKVRLERIDSQLGFAAIFYGELNTSGEALVIQGRWEATQLATGMPSAGGWRAVQLD
ncbi:MAG: hypothetical protein PVG53_11030 [Holophagae bacterium]